MSGLTRYRLLGCVLLLAILAASWELTHPEEDSTAVREQLPYVLRELYPQSTRILYTEAVAFLIEGNTPAARQKFEEILALGDKTNEDVLYYYAVTLVKMEADPQDIDRAVANWRFHFPFSDRTDPRSALDSAAAETVQPNLQQPKIRKTP